MTDQNGLFLKSTTTTTSDGVAPLIPVIDAEPEFTNGLSNRISWNDCSDWGAVSYSVECSSRSDFSVIFAASQWIAKLNYTFSSLEEKKFYYQVKSKDSSGNESEFSSSVYSTQDNTLPQPVTTLAATSLTAGDISLEWQVPQDTGSAVSYYKIYRSSDSINFAFISSTTLTQFVNYFENGLMDKTTFYYKVYPVDGVGNVRDNGNNTSSALCKEEGPRTPQLNSEPQYTQGLSNTISWNGVSDAHSYYLETDENENFATPLKTSGWTNTTYYTFTGLEDGKKYFYRIKARDNLNNESSWSFSVNSTQDNSAPEKTSDLSASIGDCQGEIKISWSAPADNISGTGSYIVKYATFSFSQNQWDEIEEISQNWNPVSDGSSEQKVISGLTANTSYWIAIKTTDSVGNTSLISNIAVSHTFTPPSVSVIYPNTAGNTLVGSQKILWSYSDLNPLDNHRFEILISSDNFETFEVVADTDVLTSNTTFYTWDSRKYFNGTSKYKIKIIAYDPANLTAEDTSDSPFSIANTNDPPVVQIIYPNGGETVSGNVNISWNAFDYNVFDNLTLKFPFPLTLGFHGTLSEKQPVITISGIRLLPTTAIIIR